MFAFHWERRVSAHLDIRYRGDHALSFTIMIATGSYFQRWLAGSWYYMLHLRLHYYYYSYLHLLLLILGL